MAGGMTAGEAVVFWLGGFSCGPEVPDLGRRWAGVLDITKRSNDADNYKLDPIDSRKWIFPCKVDRLVPRGTDGYFDGS